MANNQTEQPYRGLVRAWRIGFIILSSSMVAIFISVAVFLEISRQISLAIDWSFASLFWFAALILLVIQGALIGVWLSIQVVLGSTHPIYKQHHWRWVFISFLVTASFTITMVNFTQLLLYSYRPPSWLVLLNWDLIFNSILNLIMAFTISALSAVMWFKWLKPLTKE